MPSVSFHTLGCKLNYAETSTIESQFADRRFRIVPFGESADVAVINTCSVTEEAERKCRQVIRRAVRANSNCFVIVTGCYAQLRPADLASIPGVAAVLGTAEKLSIFDVLSSFVRTERTQVNVSCIDSSMKFGPAHAIGERTRAFLKIQDGCDYSCSFCTIPMARGRSRSQSVSATVAQARAIAAAGHKEIVLSGVNIGLYGNDNGESLVELLRQLDEVDGIERYRISSIEPNLLSDRIIDFVAESRHFMPHFHVPLQSGDDYVLGKMRRRYRARHYAQRIERIGTVLPHAGIGVDVIVGFPAETEERFANTHGFLADLPITYMHVFTYSERPGTAAVDQSVGMGEKCIPRPERSRRNKVLRVLSARKERAFARSSLGGFRPILWEGKVNAGWRFGLTDNYLRVSAPELEVAEGTITNSLLDGIAADGTVSVTSEGFIPIT